MRDFEGVTFFADSDQAEAFVATGPARDTSEAIMRAIVSIAVDLEEAEEIWAGGPEGIAGRIAWHVKRSRREPSELRWGVHGTDWWKPPQG